VQENIQTRKLQVVDVDGKVRVELGPADEGYGLVVYDKDGAFQATLTDAPLGAAIQLRNGGGSVSLMAMDGGCGITLRGKNGMPRALMLHEEDKGPEFILQDEAGKAIFSALECGDSLIWIRKPIQQTRINSRPIRRASFSRQFA